MAEYIDDDWENDPVPLPQAPEINTPAQHSRTFRGDRGRNDPNWRGRGNSTHSDRGNFYDNDQRRNGRDNFNGTGQRRNNRENWRSNPHQNSGKKIIYVPSTKVGRIIGKGGSKIRDLEYESDAKIKIGDSMQNKTDITIIGSNEAISKAITMIDDLIVDYKAPVVATTKTPEVSNTDKDNVDNKIDSCEGASKEFLVPNDEGLQIVDWAKLNAHYDEHLKVRLQNLPPIKKDFYKEDSVVAAMTPTEVSRWRLANHNIQVSRTFEEKPDLKPIPNPVLTFEQAFQDYPEILSEIYKQNFKHPSPIQSQAWPILLRGDDMIGIAQTGTGKTLAFLLPALIHIDGQIIPREQRKHPIVLIMAPTRELALQINKEVNKYQYKGIKSICLYGGTSRKEQFNLISDGVDIVIATPGRLNDCIVTGHLDIINFSYIVLDEADRMLDMGFEPQIRVCLFDTRPDRQTVMTSATWPEGVRRLAESYAKDPIKVNVGSLDLAAVHTVTQKIIFVEEADKDATLFKFLETINLNDKVIIFCGKKATARDIYTELCLKNIECQALHGDRDQIDREAALKEMLDGTVNILVATDVASRGIDIKDLTYVINLDFPRQIEEYVHRVGRTGRAGKSGTALTFMTRADWAHARELINILNEANQEVPNELEQMAQRFEAMKIRRAEDGGAGSSGRGRGRGRRDRWW